MKPIWILVMTALMAGAGLGWAADTAAHARVASTNISPEELDAFMERWKKYQSFRSPRPEDMPLVFAALARNPKGPWAFYVAMRVAT